MLRSRKEGRSIFDVFIDHFGLWVRPLDYARGDIPLDFSILRFLDPSTALRMTFPSTALRQAQGDRLARHLKF